MYENKVKWCPICNRGWVEIVKDISTSTLFCCCTECESEWSTPFDIEKSTCNLEDNFGIYYLSHNIVYRKLQSNFR